jgi:hypothetical protein
MKTYCFQNLLDVASILVGHNQFPPRLERVENSLGEVVVEIPRI